MQWVQVSAQLGSGGGGLRVGPAPTPPDPPNLHHLYNSACFSTMAFRQRHLHLLHVFNCSLGAFAISFARFLGCPALIFSHREWQMGLYRSEGNREFKNIPQKSKSVDPLPPPQPLLSPCPRRRGWVRKYVSPPPARPSTCTTRTKETHLRPMTGPRGTRRLACPSLALGPPLPVSSFSWFATKVRCVPVCCGRRPRKTCTPRHMPVP